jgi:hypothetical protein
MQTNTSGRPKGSCNAKPSQKAISGYYKLLRSAADQGDTSAAGWLCQLDLLNQQRKETAQ